MAEDPVLDRDELFARVNGNVDLLRRMVEVFVIDYPRLLEALRSAIAAGDYAGARRHVHSLHGMVANFSGHHATAAAERVGQLLREQNGAAALAQCGALDAEIGRLIPHLTALTPPPG